MNERLSPEAEQLVTAARSDLAPSRRDIDRLRARIVAGVAAGAAVTVGGTAAAAAASTGGAAAAAGSAATAGGIGIVKLVVVAAAVTGVSVTGGVMVVRRSESPPAAMSPARREGGTHPAAARDRVPHRDLPATLDLDPDPDPVPVPDPATDSRRPTRPRRIDPPGPSLASEMDLLRRARAALREDDPRSALQHLEQHARQFPSSSLAPEAAVIRIEATCAVGDRQTAHALADGFVRHWPDSPLARRVPRLCGDDP